MTDPLHENKDTAAPEAKTFRDLEWDKILDRLASFAVSKIGADRCHTQEPDTDPARIHTCQQETSEARALLEVGTDLPLEEISDLGPVLKRARKQSVLDAGELLSVYEVLSASRRTRNTLSRERERCSLLYEISRILVSLRQLEKDIRSCFDTGGEVLDTASEQLQQLRKHERALHADIVEELNRIIHSQRYQDYLQEELFTLRNGRYVIPVKIEHKGRIEGIVHDLSSSGQSIFIEPREITRLNNLLRTVQLEIEQEIRRILQDLTYQVQQNADGIEASLELLCEMDLIFARARYAAHLNASAPALNDQGRVLLKQVRHPLLVEQAGRVIPNDVELGAEFSAIIITGPNTGGKTVLLKSVGLCALMARAGMQIPADPGSDISLFDRVFTDVGDEQSIERSLSSFSARIVNLKNILSSVTPKSLVLLDEIGEGTDPRQGAALAQAALEMLATRGVRVVVTTHFRELISLGYTREGFQNASVEFDQKSLSPTYRLIMGVPGHSSAIEIAEKLGMDREVIGLASQLLGKEDMSMDRVMENLEKERQRYAREVRRAADLRVEAAKQKREHERIASELARNRKKLERETALELRREFDKAKEKIDEIARSLGRRSTKREVSEAKGRIRRLETEELSGLSDRPDIESPTDASPVEDWNSIRPGTELWVIPMRRRGILETLPDEKNRIVVSCGPNRLTIPADQVLLSAGIEQEKTPGRVRFVGYEPAASAGERMDTREQRTCDLRGLDKEEATKKMEQFLDAAFRQEVPNVYIVHGHGTGVLRDMVRQVLADSPYVKKFRPGEKGEGGDGATFVEIDAG